VSFAAMSICVASQRVFIVVSFVIDLVRKLLDTLSYTVKGKGKQYLILHLKAFVIHSQLYLPDGKGNMKQFFERRISRIRIKVNFKVDFVQNTSS